jgi:hypothetical protein
MFIGRSGKSLNVLDTAGKKTQKSLSSKKLHSRRTEGLDEGFIFVALHILWKMAAVILTFLNK